jgi:hypothetical protein
MAFTNNYVLGKGKVYVARYPAGSKIMPKDFRFVGNAPELTISQNPTKIEHFSSTAGLAEKDESVITRTDMTGKFKMDNINIENLSLWLMGTTAPRAQVAASALTYTIADLGRNRHYQIGQSTVNLVGLRNLDNVTLEVDNSAYKEVTAVTASAAGTGLTNGTRTFTVTDGTGSIVAKFSFSVASGSITGAATIIQGGRYSVDPDLTANATCTVDVGTTNAAFNLTMGTLADAAPDSAEVEIDETTGSVYLAEDAVSFSDGDTITVTYDTLAESRNVLVTGGKEVYCAIRFIADNPKGINHNIIIPYALVASDGDMSLIGETWQELSMGLEALKLNDATEKVYVDGLPLS